jgi:hypothetical protein
MAQPLVAKNRRFPIVPLRLKPLKYNDFPVE